LLLKWTFYSFFSLRKESKLSAFRSRLQWKVYASEGEGVAGGWNRLHSEEITDLRRRGGKSLEQIAH
jgi:hypothetical protein